MDGDPRKPYISQQSPLLPGAPRSSSCPLLVQLSCSAGSKAGRSAYRELCLFPTSGVSWALKPLLWLFPAL